MAGIAGGERALGGCANPDQDNDQEDEVQVAQLSYEGEAAGSENRQAQCDDDGQLTVLGALDEGDFHVQVMDGSGQTVFNETFSGNVPTEVEGMEGQTGSWQIRVDRSSGFDGAYTVALAC